VASATIVLKWCALGRHIDSYYPGTNEVDSEGQKIWSRPLRAKESNRVARGVFYRGRYWVRSAPHGRDLSETAVAVG
jgi:hypothetical protein